MKNLSQSLREVFDDRVGLSASDLSLIIKVLIENSDYPKYPYSPWRIMHLAHIVLVRDRMLEFVGGNVIRSSGHGRKTEGGDEFGQLTLAVAAFGTVGCAPAREEGIGMGHKRPSIRLNGMKSGSSS